MTDCSRAPMYRSVLVLLIVSILTPSRCESGEPDPGVQPTQAGVRLELVAEHPQLATPTGIDVDRRGRVWVVATHTHMRPKDYEGPENDEILVFQLNADGVWRRRVFYNKTTATMDLELGRDGWVYLAERDRVLRIRDSDGDGVADQEEDLATLRTEAVYPHNGLSGLAWHPDGDLVFGLGENFAKPWTLTGSDDVEIRGASQGGVFRCSASGERLQWIAKGLWNPFGVCVRQDGEIFAAENDPGERPPCRLLHIVEGGEYGYRRKYGPEPNHPFVCWNGELPGTLPMVHPTGEAPCGVLPLGRGLLVPSWGDNRIDFLRLEQNGASYKAKPLTIVQGGRYFRPTCIARDPSSKGDIRVWFLADWVDGRYNAHGLGRIWRLEVDLAKADWVGPLELPPPTDAARLAGQLRSDEHNLSPAAVRDLASHADPFVARAAIVAMSRGISHWSPNDFAKWPDDARRQGAIALRISNAQSQQWIPRLLDDPNVDVRIQGLQWIANADLASYRSRVMQMLGSDDLDYRLFEALMATWNTLEGKPEAGLRNVDALLARVRDKNSPPRIRAFALRMLPKQTTSASGPGARSPKQVTTKLLLELLDAGDPELAREAVRAAAADPARHGELLLKAAEDKSRADDLRAEAIVGLAAADPVPLAQLLRLARDSRPAVRREALRALRGADLSEKDAETLRAIQQRDPSDRQLVAALLDPSSIAKTRPPVTDIVGWLSMLERIPGEPDIEQGRRLFHHARVATCARCHRHDGRGNTVGPDLSAQHRQGDRKTLLAAILQPNRDMAPEYQPRTLVLKDGRIFTGIRLRSYTREQIRDAQGVTRTFDRSDVELIKDLDTSLMPTGLVDSLTNTEVRDLMAFLFSGKGPLEQPAASSSE